MFVLVANALTLVGLRLPVTANFRGYLTNNLLVRTRNMDRRRTFTGDRDAFGNREIHIMRETELQVQAFTKSRFPAKF